MSEKPLNVRVAEALGWTDCREARPSWEGYPPSDQHAVSVLRYDIDWSATGPIIDERGLTIYRNSDGTWEATDPHSYEADVCDHCGSVQSRPTYGTGATALQAVCSLLLALHEAGKL